MRKICLISLLILFIPTLVLATQWSSRTLATSLSTAQDDYPQSILPNGTVYKIKDGDGLYRHTYTNNYTWNSGVKCITPGNTYAITINAAGTTAIVCASPASRDIRWASSSDGLNWTWGNILTAWNRSPHYPTSVSCAWNGAGKWLYVAYEDGKVYTAPYPYSNPQQIDVGGGLVKYVTVRFTGDYMIISKVISNDTDLFELTGSGSSWSSPVSITEVNTGQEERSPVLGVISQEHENLLLWSAPGSVGGFDIYYSTGSDTSAITPTSLGRVKAMFR